jgi:hypothetical protein
MEKRKQKNEGPSWEKVFCSETLISNILLEISWVAVFSFEAKL